MKNLKNKKYHIFLINCDDCGSYYQARTKLISSPILAIRCIHCYKILGCMQYRYLGIMTAESKELAILKYKEEYRKRMKNE